MSRCYADNCPKPVKPTMLMCREHWFLVSKKTRDWVWAAYRSIEMDLENYTKAIEQARKEVAEAEKKLAERKA